MDAGTDACARHAASNTSVINIMGTSAWGDFFYDMQLWMSTFWVEYYWVMTNLSVSVGRPSVAPDCTRRCLAAWLRHYASLPGRPMPGSRL